MSRPKVGSSEPTLASALGRFYPPHPKFFAKLRRQFNLTQLQIATRLGIRENTWARWERGRMQIPPLIFAGVLAVTQTWRRDRRRRGPL